MKSIELTNNELEIMFFALNNLTYSQEQKLSEEYGSVSSFYNKLYSIREGWMNQNEYTKLATQQR